MTPSPYVWRKCYHKYLLLVLQFMSFDTNLSAASSISSNQSLTGSQTITSEGGNFVLGFFSPGKSQSFYIGIWFKRVSKQTVVWVANRETPVLDPSSYVLKISDDGNLVVLNNNSKIPIWSTNSTKIFPNSTIAELLDTGNLVLRDGSNSSKVFWQSFDYPTDTCFPGSKIGLNKVTGENQLLTSWKSSEDPSPGPYSLQIDPSGSSQYIIQWNRSRTYWTSGTWNGQIFSLVPEMTSNYIYNFSYISNDKENYFIYSVKNKDSSVITRFVMDLSGQIKQQTWLDNTQEWILFWSQPRGQCDVYSLCGAFSICNEKSLPYCSCLKGFTQASPTNWGLNDLSGGCERRAPLHCDGTGDQGGFYAMQIMKLSDGHQITFPVANSEQCASACLQNCYCTAYSYGSNCSMWLGNLINLQQLPEGSSNSETLYLRLAASELRASGSKRGVIIIATAIVTGVAVILALVGFTLLLIHRCRRNEFQRSRIVEGVLVPFRYQDLRRATKNFSHKLGSGAFGTVFKGELHGSTEIAVKKLEDVTQGEKQFRAEVSTIGTIQHVNLVRLRGFCSEGSRRLLVYNYMPRGSLDAALFRGSSVMDWRTRYGVSLGTARGLAYLHEKCRDCIIHCDIKPENILLDGDFVPKVADFGLAKLLGRDFSRVLTTMRGTRGYLAPEWMWGVAITAKADVYSYGMMLMEIVSGRRNSGESFFSEWAATRLEEGVGVVDPRLEGKVDMEEVKRVCKVAYWCIQEDEAWRPSMGEVVQILEGVVEVNVPPMPRVLRLMGGAVEKVRFIDEDGSEVSPLSGRSVSAVM